MTSCVGRNVCRIRMPSWMGEAPIKDRRVLGSDLFGFFDAGFEAGDFGGD